MTQTTPDQTYILELTEEFGEWRWFQMADLFKCEDEGGPFPSREAAESNAYEVCGDVFYEVSAPNQVALTNHKLKEKKNALLYL